MEYLKIIEENFTTEEFVAYLRGSILKALLSEQPLVLSEFKLYANKLVEVVKEAPADEPPVKIDVFRPVVKSTGEASTEPTVDPDEPKVQPKHEFKIGDRVIVSKGTVDERTGTIIRLPMDNSRYQEYIVDLDDKALGWEATIVKEGVSCKNAWYGCKENMTLLEPSIKGSLEVGKWYHTTDFTAEELQQLLPSGTTVETEKKAWYNGIETESPTNTQTGVVVGISTSCLGDEPLIETNGSIYLKEWFKLQEDL